MALDEEKYTLDKIVFNKGMCDYLKVLKDRNISHEIPTSLPASIDRMYSRFECAVGATWWSQSIRGFFGVNGYAITYVGYIGDDRYESYDICFCANTTSFHIGVHAIKMISGFEIPKDCFIEKLSLPYLKKQELANILNRLNL
ncbi:hypothetical protein [Holdemanella biformis]|uniref:hypothetical protein n=1 Tax=Holdemanella biformis TaxID=1735 RepID=UPI0022E337A3|nr:hypothetical protein [Holdemanella biformis]